MFQFIGSYTAPHTNRIIVGGTPIVYDDAQAIIDGRYLEAKYAGKSAPNLEGLNLSIETTLRNALELFRHKYARLVRSTECPRLGATIDDLPETLPAVLEWFANSRKLNPYVSKILPMRQPADSLDESNGAEADQYAALSANLHAREEYLCYLCRIMNLLNKIIILR
jgi:hypothetical protein